MHAAAPAAMLEDDMGTNEQPGGGASSDQREALKQSEKKANEQQPGSFKDEETAEKVVEIPPAGPGKKPIRGLDS